MTRFWRRLFRRDFVRVFVSDHAEDRGIERHEGRNIGNDVADAIRFGRVGTHHPVHGGRAKDKALHVWSKDKQRVYIVAATGKAWVVVTALPPYAPRETAVGAALKKAMAL